MAMLVRLLIQVIKFTLQQRTGEKRRSNPHHYEAPKYNVPARTHNVTYMYMYLDMLGEAVRASREPMEVPASSRSSSTFNRG